MKSKCMIIILLLSFCQFACQVKPLRRCPKKNGVFSKPGSFCKSFYECKNWKLKVKKCPDDQHFYPEKGYCVWSEKFPCSKSFCQFDCQAQSLKKCPRKNGVFPKPGSFCRSFYICKNWELKVRKCPDDQHFYPEGGYCVWPEDFPCSEKPQFFECPTPNGKFLKRGTGCKVYYNCCNGLLTEKRCPGDLVFDHIWSKCEWPELYTCIDGTSSRKATFTTPVATTSTVANTRSRTFDISTVTEQPLTSSSDSSDSKTTDGGDIIITGIEKSSTNAEKELTASHIPTSISSAITVDKFTSSHTNDVSENNRETTFTVINEHSTVTTDSKTSSVQSSTKYEKTTFTTPVTTTSTVANTGSIKFDISTVTEQPLTSARDSSDSETIDARDITITDIEKSSTNLEKELTVSNTPTAMSSVFTVDIFTSSHTNGVSENEKKTTFTVINESSTVTIDSTTSSDQSSTKYEEITNTKDIHHTTMNDDTISYSNTDDFSVYTTGSTETDPQDIDLTTITLNDFTESVTVDIYCPEPSGYFPHPTDRHKFIGCVGGIPYIFNCPSDLVYVHEKNQCDYDDI